MQMVLSDSGQTHSRTAYNADSFVYPPRESLLRAVPFARVQDVETLTQAPDHLGEPVQLFHPTQHRKWLSSWGSGWDPVEMVHDTGAGRLSIAESTKTPKLVGATL